MPPWAAAAKKQDTVDAYLSGKFELGGRKHDLVVGMSSTRTAARTDGYTSVAGWSYVIPNIYTWDGNAPAPTYSKTGAWRTQITQQTGLFASARWRVTDPLSVLTGLRLTDWHRHPTPMAPPAPTRAARPSRTRTARSRPSSARCTTSRPRCRPMPATRASSTRRTTKDRNNNPLSPVIGSNAEAGLKAELFERRIQAHFAVFQTKQDNFGVRDGAITTPLPDGTLPYVAVNGTKSTGFELEFAGMATRQWRVSAGLTRAKVTRAPTDLIYANMPDYLLQLGTDYQLSARSRRCRWAATSPGKAPLKASTSRTPAAP